MFVLPITAALNKPNLSIVPLPKSGKEEQHVYLKVMKAILNDDNVLFWGDNLIYINDKLVAILHYKGFVDRHEEYSGVLINPETKMWSQNHDYSSFEIDRHLMSVA